MRARGLKLALSDQIDQVTPVAPHAGAWIETLLSCRLYSSTQVAPHAGAWIETAMLRGFAFQQ